jgi:putative ABC transport system permease protein
MTNILALVVREGLTLPSVGLAIGLAASLFLTRALRSMLYGVSATNPIVFGAVAALLAAVAAIACYVPARRTARVDPVVALKSEA